MQSIYTLLLTVLVAIVFFSLGWAVAWRMLSRSQDSGQTTHIPPKALPHSAPLTPRDWLLNLPPHDGIWRAHLWLQTFLNVKDCEYARHVSLNFLLGMVGRAMEPGSRFEHCLVLVGAQGGGKSSVLRTLAGEFYDDTDIDLRDKDAMAGMTNVWLHEFAEMGELTRLEASSMKSFLTRSTDEFRPAYRKASVITPRTTVFAFTSGDWDYLKHIEGRRFWPVEVGTIYLDELSQRRDQLFAEVLHLYRHGARYSSAPTHAKQGNNGVEQGDGVAQKDDTVAVLGNSQDHLQAGSSGLNVADTDTVHRSEHRAYVHETSQAGDAVITGIGNGIALKIADHNGNADPLLAATRFDDGQLNAANGGQECAEKIHSNPPIQAKWPGGTVKDQPIDWSPLADRKVIVHPDDAIGK